MDHSYWPRDSPTSRNGPRHPTDFFGITVFTSWAAFKVTFIRLKNEEALSGLECAVIFRGICEPAYDHRYPMETPWTYRQVSSTRQSVDQASFVPSGALHFLFQPILLLPIRTDGTLTLLRQNILKMDFDRPKYCICDAVPLERTYPTVLCGRFLTWDICRQSAVGDEYAHGLRRHILDSCMLMERRMCTLWEVQNTFEKSGVPAPQRLTMPRSSLRLELQPRAYEIPRWMVRIF